jgi:hypothetical protein
MEQDIKHRIYWDEELGVARAIGNGPADEFAARWMLQETEKISAEHGDGIDWLLDLSGITNTTARGRKILAQVSGHPSIRKYAMVGASTFMRTVANFINSAGGNSASRHFSTEEEALNWLRE